MWNEGNEGITNSYKNILLRNRVISLPSLIVFRNDIVYERFETKKYARS